MDHLEFINDTPFAGEQFILLDETGRENLVIVLKATYEINNNSALKLAEEQIPVILSPEYYGEPGESSLKYDSEVVLTKLSTDVVLMGHAYPKKPGDTEVDIMVKVGPIKKIARVFGDRYWTKFMGIKRLIKPKPFDKMPLVYENAFGGWDRSNKDTEKHACETRNPVGTGYRDKKHGKFEEGKKLPNIENPFNLIKDSKDAPAPTGFGFIAPDWEPRLSYAGTYDDNWKNKRMSLPPEDFNRRFYNSAHPDMIAKGFLKGDEPIELYFVSPEKRLTFSLPGEKCPEAEVTMKDGEKHQINTNLDTVILNTDEKKVFLIWRGSLDIYNKVYEVRSANIRI